MQGSCINLSSAVLDNPARGSGYITKAGEGQMGEQKKLFHLGNKSKEPVSDLNRTKLCCCRNGSIQHRKRIGTGLHPTSHRDPLLWFRGNCRKEFGGAGIKYLSLGESITCGE